MLSYYQAPYIVVFYQLGVHVLVLKAIHADLHKIESARTSIIYRPQSQFTLEWGQWVEPLSDTASGNYTATSICSEKTQSLLL